MIRRVLVVIGIVAVLPSCATLTQPFQVKTPIPANLTTECQPLPKLESNSVEALIDLFIEVTGLYHECAAGKKDLAAAVKNRDK